MNRGFIVLISLLIIFFACKNKEENEEENIEIKTANELAFYNFSKEFLNTKNRPPEDSNTIKVLENYFRYFWDANDLSGGILVAKGDTIFYENYRGFANRKDSIKINKNTPIHLASVSKNLTAMMVLKLIEKEKLSLNQTVTSVLDKFPYPTITIKDLLTHRSGLGNYDFYAETPGWREDGKPFTNQKLYEMYANCQPSLIFRPNTQFSYCNTNYAFLALVIEKITEMKYPEAMKTLLFEPLGMKDTYVFEKQHFETASLSYFRNGKPYLWDFRDLIYGDKNIYSTPRDLFKYSKAMFSNKFIKKALLDSAMKGYSNERKGTKNYGFGFRMFDYENGKKITFHNGWWHGNNTVFVHLPDEELTIIALGNKQSRAVYSAFSLISLFGDYPIEVEDREELEESDTIEVDSTHVEFINTIETFKKEKAAKNKIIKKDTVKTQPKLEKIEKEIDSL